MKRVLLIFLVTLVSALGGYARETVKGTVVNSKGEPVPGVKVEVPGSSEFVFTDFDGVFQIVLHEPVKKLNFTYPGYGTTPHNVAPEMTVVLGKGWEGVSEGYRGMLDLEGGMGLGGNVTIKSGDAEFRNLHTLLLAGATTTHGAQINPNLFFGLGTGAYLEFTQFQEIGKYDNYNSTELSGVNIPLFIYARWDFGLTQKIAPYVGLRLGYSMYIPADGYFDSVFGYDDNVPVRLHVDRNFIGSFFYQPTFGYRISVYHKFSINLGLSYLSGRLSKYTAETEYPNHNSKSKFIQRDAGTLLFNIGFDF